MKKAHHIDITNPGCNSDDIKKELQDFYSSLSKNQEKHSVIKIKNKAKVSKMIESIQVMIENNSSNINPYLEELSNILTFLVSPNIDDVDIRNKSIKSLFLLISLFESFDKEYLTPIIKSLFSIPNENDKKPKNSKKIMITSIFDRFINQIKEEEELSKKRILYQIIFFCIFPTLKQNKQLDPEIIPECSNSCMESIVKLVSKATETNTMDYFLKEENSFFIFESAVLLKNMYNYSDDRRYANLFYSRIFPCTFYYVDLDLSAHKFERKDDMNEILQNRRYSGWGGPNLLASFNSEPRSFFYKIIDLILNSKIENAFVILLEPMFEAVCFMLNKIKESKDIAKDIINLYFIIMRLRNVIKLSYKASENKMFVDLSLSCMILYIHQLDASYKEYFPLFLSFYLTSIFDSKRVNINETKNFIKSIISLSNMNEYSKTNIMAQISVHVIALITIAISPYLLEIPKEQSKVFLTNAMEMKISLKPLSLTLMRRITANNIYFFMQIIGCDLSEIIHKDPNDNSSLPNESNLNSVNNNNLNEDDKWTKEKASEFILSLAEAIDPNVNFVASATVADILFCILKETSDSNPVFIFSKVLPVVFYNALNKNPDISVFMPVLRKIIRNAHHYGFLNTAMSHDWIRVIQKYIFSKSNRDYKNELIFGVAQSIIKGYPNSLSLIPIFVVFVNEVINPDINADDSKSNGMLFSKHALLICTCLVDIIIITRNNPIFSKSNPTIDITMKNILSNIFDGNESIQLSFEKILYYEGGLRRKCLLLLKQIISTINQNDLKNFENLILLLLFGEIVQKNDSNNNNDNNEDINNIIESILIDNFLKADRLITMTLEFYHMLTLLLQYFNQVMKKFPNLISTIIYTISMILVEQKSITIDQYKLLLRFVTNLSLVKDNNIFLHQCLNIISLTTNSPEKNALLNKSFNTFVYNFKKKTFVVNLKCDDLILLNESGTIYSLKFNQYNSDEKINSMMVQISHEDGSNNYMLKFKNNFLKEGSSIINKNNDSTNQKTNQASTSFKLFKEFISYPSTAFLFEFLSESNHTTIKGTSKNSNCTQLIKKAFMRDQHSFIDSGIIFIGKNQIHKEEFLQNEWKNVSSTFCKFLSSIGHFYKPTEIPFLIDSDEKYDELKNDEAVLCWNNSFHKVIYNVSPLSKYDKNDRFDQNWKRFKDKKYLVFWSETSKQIEFFSEGFLSEGKLECAFVVKPYNKDMAILTIFQKRSNLPILGFFKKELLLPFDLIGFVISSHLVLIYDLNKQLHSLPSDEFKKYKDLYENKLNNDAIMFKQ